MEVWESNSRLLNETSNRPHGFSGPSQIIQCPVIILKLQISTLERKYLEMFKPIYESTIQSSFKGNTLPFLVVDLNLVDA